MANIIQIKYDNSATKFKGNKDINFFSPDGKTIKSYTYTQAQKIILNYRAMGIPYENHSGYNF